MRAAAAVAVVIVLAAPGCGDPSGPQQTIHTLPVVTDETWTRAASPHIVRGHLFISSDATLTIEAGATVLFDTLSLLTFGSAGGPGALRALGTSAQPITMRSLDTTAAPGFWVGLALRSNTASEMHYVELSGCGSQYLFDSLPSGCIGLGSPLRSENPTLLIDHVTVRDARGGAVILSNDSHFATGSTHLSVVNMRGYIAQMRARESATFPLGGSFAGNDYNEVRLTLDTLRDSVTWAGGVPWTVTDNVLIEGPKQPVLTIPPGDTIRLRASIVVGVNAPGGLRIGNESGPNAVLRAADTSWLGIELAWHSIPSSITNVVLDNCGRVENSNPTFAYACISVTGDYYGVLPDPAPVLRHVTFNALNVGLGLGAGGRLGAGSTDLTINGVSGSSRLFGFGPPISISGRSSPSSIPPGDYTRTIRHEIWLTELTVPHDDSFPNLGVPYLVFNGISVGDTTAINNPTLTLVPGITLAFTGGSHLWVGWDRPGTVRAIGTAAQPVTLTGQGSSPGAWAGVKIGYSADSATLFDHVIVDRAGAADPWVAGSFQFYIDIGPVIHNSLISNSAGCAVNIINQPPWSTDFTDPALGNTFTNNAGGAVCGP
ncbi:MAG TPA: hypothetical protein VF919_14590 [Gemmatimonadales bacterium]